MKKLYLILIALLTTRMQEAHRDTVDQEVRYHEVCFLTSHNSYAAWNHGFFYAQQALSLTEQLKQGVRGFMLDTHLDRSCNVVLCHGNERITRFIKRGKAPLLLHEELKPLAHFLRTNPTEIITIFLENYVHDKQLLDTAFRTSGIADYILTPSDWDPTKQNGWPTLKWMHLQNKRLIIFNSLGETSLAYNQWQHVAENQWGTLIKRRACLERRESFACRSHKRYLYVVNYFPSFRFNFGGSYQHINSTKLDHFLCSIFKGLNGKYAQQRLPNFISVDFTNEGDPMKHVSVNNTYRGRTKRLLFRPLEPDEH